MKDESFATLLRSLREQQGLSQYAVSKRSGLSKQAISQLELGQREPAWHTVQLLALALGVDCTAFADSGVKLPEPEPPAKRGRPGKTDASQAAEVAKKGRKRKG